MTDTAPAAPADAPEQPMLYGRPVTEVRGQVVVHVDRAGYLELMRRLADDGYVMCHDLCGVDELGRPDRALPSGVERGRFEVVVTLQSLDPPRRLRVRAQVPEDDPVIPSLFDLWPGTEAMEREAFDMFGIRFDGHPDLTRILMPEDWDGYPLRKDYDQGRIPVQFKDAPDRR
jgi:NADH-quinone oxidoreductase subunit C